MIETLKVGDLVLVQTTAKGDIWEGLVIEVPDHEVFVVDRLQRAVRVEVFQTPRTAAKAVRPRPVGSSSFWWIREQDLQAVAS